jgi:hypothetical protein
VPPLFAFRFPPAVSFAPLRPAVHLCPLGKVALRRCLSAAEALFSLQLSPRVVPVCPRSVRRSLSRLFAVVCAALDSSSRVHLASVALGSCCRSCFAGRASPSSARPFPRRCGRWFASVCAARPSSGPGKLCVRWRRSSSVRKRFRSAASRSGQPVGPRGGGDSRGVGVQLETRRVDDWCARRLWGSWYCSVLSAFATNPVKPEAFSRLQKN